MTDKTRSALLRIATLHDSDDYKAVTKTDLWEALKYARHVAKAALRSEGEAP